MTDSLAAMKERFEEQFAEFWHRELPQCDTTMTPRLPRTSDCACQTYAGNLGPCIQLGELGPTGKCPYCDHLPECHLREVFRAGWQAAQPSAEKIEEVARQIASLPNFIGKRRYIAAILHGELGGGNATRK